MLRPSRSAAVQFLGSADEMRAAHHEKYSSVAIGQVPAAARRSTISRKGGAWPNLLGREAVDLGVAAIAQDQPLLAVKKAHALGDIVHRGLIAQRLRPQLRVPGLKIARNGPVGLGGRP
jgi:hypothetical protein